MKRILRVCDLGEAAYKETLSLQERLFERRSSGAIPDTLLLLEHRDVLTLGRNAKEDNIIAPLEQLRERGVAVERTGRGGDVTYHGPGQLVGYPIVSLKDAGIGVSDYVGAIEDVIIEVLRAYGLEAGRDRRNRGVWIGNSKIAAIGLRVRRHVSIHGFALNVSTDLSMYNSIVPCGVADAGVTSMSNEGCDSRMQDVKERIVSAFSVKLGYSGVEYVSREVIEKA